MAQELNELTPAELKARLDEGERLVVLDVRADVLRLVEERAGQIEDPGSPRGQRRSNLVGDRVGQREIHGIGL